MIKTELRIIIAGSRTFSDYQLLKQTVKKVLTSNGYKTKKVAIVSGTANGADKLGERFAKEFDIKCYRFPADWNRYGKSAGYRRNKEMAQFAVKDNNVGLLIAFWDGKSKGTKHMIDLAKEHNLDVHVENF